MNRIRNIIDDALIYPDRIEHNTTWGVARFIIDSAYRMDKDALNKFVIKKVKIFSDHIICYGDNKATWTWYFTCQNRSLTFLFEDNTRVDFDLEKFENNARFCEAIFTFLMNWQNNGYELPNKYDDVFTLPEEIIF